MALKALDPNPTGKKKKKKKTSQPKQVLFVEFLHLLTESQVNTRMSKKLTDMIYLKTASFKDFSQSTTSIV